MRSVKTTACVLLLVLAAIGVRADADGIVCERVLGNSGEQGKCLVKFAPQGARGMGVAYDRFGSLWDRAGAGNLNRYSPDGRLLCQFRIPRQTGDQDKLTLVGDLLLMQINGKLHTLDANAPPGSEAKSLGVESECMSFGSVDGSIASYGNGKIRLVNVKTGQMREAPGSWDISPKAKMSCLELCPDGKIVSQIHSDRLRLFVDGKEVPGGLTEKPSASRIQFLDGFWYGHAWHATIKRFDLSFQPAPGVVLGGASGWFIGHLDENYELFSGCGMAKLAENLYAVSGQGGIMHLLEWQADKQNMRIVRRIGSVHCTGIGLDREGNVWAGAGTWKWADGPDAPLQNGISGQTEMGQAVMLEGDQMVQPATRWGKSMLLAGRLTTEPKFEEVRGVSFLKGHVGAAVYPHQGKLVLLLVDKTGKAQALYIGSDGAYLGEGPSVAIKTSSATKEWTSLAMKDASTLLGAADGAVIELTKDGNDWREARRWNSWGTSELDHFGQKVFVSADAGRLWVSDHQRARALCFDLQTGKLHGAFGTADRAGDDMQSLNLPEVISARASRAVVYDSGNQRLMKLKIVKPTP